MFRIDSEHLPVDCALIEQRTYEKLSKHVKRFFKAISSDVEVVVRACERRPRVVIAAIALDKVGIFILIGIFRSANEEHML